MPIRAAERELATRWQFQLLELPSMQVIDDLTHGLDKKLSLVMNRPGAFNARFDIRDSVSPLLIPRRAGIIAVRNGLDVWGGFINTRNIDPEGGFVDISAAGWLEDLYGRSIRTQMVREPELDKDRAFALLDTVNTQTDSQGNIEHTMIYPGNSFGGSETRGAHTYDIAANIGEEIQALSDLESGFDMIVGPRTRILDLRSWYAFDTRDVYFGYMWGAENVARLSWSEDASRMCNHMNTIGKDGARGNMVDDPFSIALYGVREETVTLSDVADSTILTAFAEAEMVIRSHPQLIFSVTPYPPTTDKSVPEFMEDYKVGDLVHLSSRDPILQIDNQAMRVFGVDVEITSEAHEIISQLQVTNQGAGQ